MTKAQKEYFAYLDTTDFSQEVIDQLKAMDLACDQPKREFSATGGKDTSLKNSRHIDHTHMEYPKVSSALAKYCYGAEHVTEGRHKGKPIITSRNHEQELCKMHSMTRDYHDSDQQKRPTI